MSETFNVNTLYHNINQSTGGYFIVTSTDQFYVEGVQYRRLMDAVAHLNGTWDERLNKKGRTTHMSKPKFGRIYLEGRR